MKCDYAEKEADCKRCETPEEFHLPDGYCEVCLLRALDLKFPLDFREWVSNLIRLHNWRKAGYPIPQDELDYEGWQALAWVTRWFELKDLEARMQGAVL